jgi:hypothetical protein
MPITNPQLQLPASGGFIRCIQGTESHPAVNFNSTSGSICQYEQRAQAQAKQAQMDQLNQASQTAKNLGQTPTNGQNAMTDVINMFSGYNSPSPMQV